jgi:hypothetical protein
VQILSDSAALAAEDDVKPHDFAEDLKRLRNLSVFRASSRNFHHGDQSSGSSLPL